MLFPPDPGGTPDFKKRSAIKAGAAIERPLDSVSAGATVHGGGRFRIAAFRLAVAGRRCASGISPVPGKVADLVCSTARPGSRRLFAGGRSLSPPISRPSLPSLYTRRGSRRRGSLLLFSTSSISHPGLALSRRRMVYPAGAAATELDLFEQMRAAAAARLQERLAGFAVTGSADTVCGPPAGTIISRARTAGAGLIVVGTHGRTGFARLTLGSTAEHIVDRAPCSVLVVRLAI